MVNFALCAQLLLWLIVLQAFLMSRQASLFHPLAFYLGFHALVFVLRPALVYCLHFDTLWQYMHMAPTDADFIRTLAVSSVALVAFSIPCLAAGWSQTAFPTLKPAPFTDLQRQGLILTTILLLPIIAYSIRSLTSGGMKGEHIGGVFIQEGASGYTLEAQFMAGPLICAWLAVTRFNPFVLLPLMLYIAYRAYEGWNRWTIILLFLTICLVYAWQNRRKWMPWWSVALAIPVFMLFQTLGANRDYFQMWLNGETIQKPTVGLTHEEEMRVKYDNQNFANFDYLAYIVKVVPDRTGTFTYGSQYLQLFTEPIPRKLWPGKPIGAPVYFFNLNNYGDFLGLTPSLPGDGWMSGGWAGVIITLGIVGFLLGLAHRWFWRHVRNNIAALFYLVGMAMLPQWYRDGGISIAKFLFWNLSPLLLWLACNWLLGTRLMPAESILLPRGTRLRLISSSTANTSSAPVRGDSQ